MKKIVKCVLFDLDGTLVSTGGAGNRALEKAFLNLFNVPNSMRDINPAGKTDPAIIREMVSACFQRECGEEEMRSIQEKYLEFLPEECTRSKRYRVMEGIPELLKELEGRNVPTGLGTGNLERGARVKLERSGLNRFFPFGGYGSDSETRSELLRAGLRKAEEYAGTAIQSGNVFIIGDTERDILAAKKMNFKVIAVATGNCSEKILSEYEPDFLMPNFKNGSRFLDIICTNGAAVDYLNREN